jgi:hypothetical protein
VAPALLPTIRQRAGGDRGELCHLGARDCQLAHGLPAVRIASCLARPYRLGFLAEILHQLSIYTIVNTQMVDLLTLY